MIELPAAVERLSALAHEARLEAFRLLVRAGPEGLSAGALAGRLGLGATAVSFHLNRLRQAGLVHRRRAGQKLIYAADFVEAGRLVAFLNAECCAESATDCGPGCGGSPKASKPARTRKTG